MSEDIRQEERTLVVDIFSKELKASGYTRHKAREIVVCGLLGLERKRKRREREGETFHRRARMTIQKRTNKKLHGKQSWFKTKPRDGAEELEKMKENRERLRDDEDIYWKEKKCRQPRTIPNWIQKQSSLCHTHLIAL